MSDLTHLNCPIGYGEQSLQRYARAIGVEYNSLRRYRDVAQAYESATRVADLPWYVHRVLASQPDRYELIQARDDWTVPEAPMKLMNVHQIVREMSPMGDKNDLSTRTTSK